MPQITTFADAQDALRPFYDYSHTAYNLDNMRQLMAYLGNPQDKLRVVHVAGTSGKTSTAYYAAALLGESGVSVGLSVSPHVDTVNERLQINGTPLPEAEFCAVLDEFLQLIAGCDIQPSYFELLAAMAFWEFARRGLNYAVIEVGLGGLLDATNVVDRTDKVCIITDIGLDHTEILGDTLPKIAAQKAGIIQNGNKVFMYEQGAEVMQVVRRVANDHVATLNTFGTSDSAIFDGLPLFQQRNLGLALKAVNYINERDGRSQITDTMLQKVSQIVVPARLERFSIGDKTVIVDGSHNQQKIATLLESIQVLYPGQKMAALVGFVKGNSERWQGGLSKLLPQVKSLVFTGFYSEKDLPKTSMDPQVLADFARAQNFMNYSVVVDPAEALNELLKRPEQLLLVTGSFYLLNHVRPQIAKLA